MSGADAATKRKPDVVFVPNDPPEPLEQLRVTVLEAANIVRRLRAFYRPMGAGEDAEAMDVNNVIKASVELTKPKWKAQSAAKGAVISCSRNRHRLRQSRQRPPPESGESVSAGRREDQLGHRGP